MRGEFRLEHGPVQAGPTGGSHREHAARATMDLMSALNHSYLRLVRQQ